MDQLTLYCLIAFGLLAIVGIALLIFGLRRRRLDDHPLCRRCGFDLTGKPAESTRCAECGADVTCPKSIRIGHHRRRPMLLLAGAFLFLVSVPYLCIQGPNALRSIDWQHVKPLWLLERQSIGHGVNRRQHALDEINRRYEDHLLSPSQFDSLVSFSLDVQADPKLPWDGHFAFWIEWAALHKTLSDADFRRFTRQSAPTFSMKPQRPHAAPGDYVPIEIVEQCRAGPGGPHQGSMLAHWDGPDSPLSCHRHLADARLEIDGKRISFPRVYGQGDRDVDCDLDDFAIPSGCGFGIDTGKLHLSVGRHVLSYQVPLTVCIEQEDRQIPVVRLTPQAQTIIDVVPPDQSSLIAVSDPKYRGQIRRLLRADFRPIQNAPDRYAISICAKQSFPIEAYFKASVAADGREWPIYHWFDGRLTENAHLAGFPSDARTVNIVLRPSRFWASMHYTTRYWNGTIRLNDVPIQPGVKSFAAFESELDQKPF